MKKLYLASLLSVGLSISAFGAQSTPISTTEKPALPSVYAGISTCDISNSTGTSALLCTSGAGIILDIVGSSVATTDAIIIRDSATANTSSTVLYSISQSGLTGVHVFPRFKNGLAVNLSTAPTAAGTNRPAWTVIYTKDLY